MAAPHLEEFLDTARYFIGLTESGNNRFTDPRGAELWNLWGGNANGVPWCAIFVSACAQKAGILNVIIAKSSWARGILEDTRDKFGGTWIDGPYLNGGNSVIPQPGDCILFYTGPGRDDRHVGIVESADASAGTVTTIEGNAGDACRRKEYKADHSRIYAYVRPDWSKVGDDVNSGSTIGDATIGPLYDSRNDRHDMTLRQVGYLDNYSLSNRPSNIAISVINYTSVLGDLYEMFAPAQVNQVEIDTSQLSGNIRTAVDYFLSKGYWAAGACALTGCLLSYSKLSSSYYQALPNNVFLYGIAAWNSIKLTELRQRVGNDWAQNLSGQLEYFIYDLELNYKFLSALCKTKTLDEAKAASLASSIMTSYNRYVQSAGYISEAVDQAKAIYNELIITETRTIGNSSSELKNENGNVLSAQNNVDIPGSVQQTGIIDDFTSYSYWFSKWNRRSPQKKLADKWEAQGYPCDKGIATIGGYYCIATTSTFGTCGDAVLVTLEDNQTFPAIICDIKEDGTGGNPWGHPKGNGVSVIEWQRVKTQNGRVLTSGITAGQVDTLGFDSWLGKRVINITNYGKYADVRWS